MIVIKDEFKEITDPILEQLSKQTIDQQSNYLRKFVNLLSKNIWE